MRRKHIEGCKTLSKPRFSCQNVGQEDDADVICVCVYAHVAFRRLRDVFMLKSVQLQPRLMQRDLSDLPCSNPIAPLSIIQLRMNVCVGGAISEVA